MNQIIYKDTLNLPQTSFPMKAGLPQNEPKTLAKWEADRIYEQIQAARADAPLFVLHDGPPFANGDVHIGTALNKILKDTIIKFKTMKGYRAPYVPGWDCHGQPIEFKVKKELGDKARQISQSELRKLCRTYAEKYINIQRQQFKRLGVFGDWEHPYLTMSAEYEADIIGALADMAGEGYIYRGRKPVHWCASCRTALAEAEVEYGDHTSTSVYVKFAVEGRPHEYAVIWTTTPWTLPANVAIAARPDLAYVRARTADGETWIVAEGLAESIAQNCGVTLSVAERVFGKDLEGLKARHPFVDRTVPVVASPYVTLEQGTGLVHTAPGHGAEDYEIGQKYGLPTLAPVDDGGVFTEEAGAFASQFVFKANKAIVARLQGTGHLAGQGEVKHSYPHCWRCRQPVIFRAVEQWFIAIDHCGMRQSALDEIKKINWVPKWGQNRISGTIEQRPDWCISRQRAWGVPLPFLICRSCARPVVDRGLILKFREQVAREGVDIWFERTVAELFGSVECPHCKSHELDKCQDIIDVWFESGVSHRAVLKQRRELRFPADVYLEGSDQHRGWFQSSLLTAMATENRSPFQTVVTHGFLVVRVEETGKKQKISKSAGRPANSEDYVNKYGADILRLWVLSEDYQADIPLSDEIFDRISETYRKIRNTLRILLANLYDFDPARDGVGAGNREVVDRWLESRLQDLIAEVTAAYERFEFHRVYHLVNQFCAVELSSFYVDVTKDLLYTLAPNSPGRRSAQQAMHVVASALARMLAPVMPFTAEEVWQSLPGQKPGSVHLSAFPVVEASRRDETLEKRWEQLMVVRQTAMNELEKARQDKVIGKSLEAALRVEPDTAETKTLLESFGGTLETVFIVSRVEVGAPTGKPTRVIVQKPSGAKCARCWRWSDKVGVSHEHPELCDRCADVVNELAQK
jgi:isoleucyl-tRNA synthetase